MSKPSEPPSVGQVLVTKDARLLGVGRTVKGCKFVNLDASTEVSDHSILGTEGEVVSFHELRYFGRILMTSQKSVIRDLTLVR